MDDNTKTNINKIGPISSLDDNGSFDRKLSNVYDDLPNDIQEAIVSVDSSEAIMEIGQKYSLHLDQIAVLGQETGYIMLGITDPVEFVNKITTKLGVDKNIANQIAGEINEKIFIKIKESLRAIHSGKKIITQATIGEKAPDLMKTVEAERLNIPQKTMDVLHGNISEEKKKDMSIFGFQTEDSQKPIGEMNILEEKMKTGFSVKGEITDRDSNQTIGKEVDPYKEVI